MSTLHHEFISDAACNLTDNILLRIFSLFNTLDKS